MISMEIKRGIFHLYFHERKSLRDISKELMIHRNTVKKYVSEFEEEIKTIVCSGDEIPLDIRELVTKVVKKASYNTVNREIIDEDFLNKVRNILLANPNTSIVSMYINRNDSCGEIFFSRRFGLTTFYKAVKKTGYKKRY